jgi:dienelactone hydrolase
MHSLENIVLWENLASHGYVVAVTPSLGHQSVAMEPVGPTSAEVKTRDLEFMTTWLRSVPFADTARIAAAGFSLGGWSALMYGMRSADIDAVVALDGSFNLPNRVAAVRAMPFFRPSIFALPILNLRQDEPEIDVSVIESFTNGERYDTAIGDLEPPNASHHSFTSIYTFSDEFFPPRGNSDERTSLKYNRDIFELVAQRVRLFLDAYLRGDSRARAELQRPPQGDGVPERMIRHRYLEPSSR